MSSRSIHEEITFIVSLISKSSSWIINITYQWLVSISDYQCLSVSVSVIIYQWPQFHHVSSFHHFLCCGLYNVHHPGPPPGMTELVPTPHPSQFLGVGLEECSQPAALFEDASAKVKGPVQGPVSFQELTDQWGDRACAAWWQWGPHHWCQVEHR